MSFRLLYYDMYIYLHDRENDEVVCGFYFCILWCGESRKDHTISTKQYK